MQPDVVSRSEELPFADVELRRRRLPARRAPLRRRRAGGAGDGAGRRPPRADRPTTSTAARRSRRPRSCATRRTSATTASRRVARAPRGRRRPGRRRRGVRRSRSSSSRGSTARAARARTPSASASSSPTGSRTAGHARPDRDQGGEELVAIVVDTRHEARRPGPDRPRGHVPRAAQPRLRDAARRRRDAGQGRPGRRGRAGLRHGRRGGRRDGREHVDDLRPGPVRDRRDLRGGRRRDRHGDLHLRGARRARHAPRLQLHPPARRDDARAELPGRAVAGQGERRDHPGGDLQRGLDRPRLPLGDADLPDRPRADRPRARQLDDRRDRRRPVVGSSFIDVLEKFEADPETEIVVMVGEIGGDEEEKAARFIAAEMSKPVVAYIAGFSAPPGQDDGPRGRDHHRLVGHRRRRRRKRSRRAASASARRRPRPRSIAADVAARLVARPLRPLRGSRRTIGTDVCALVG